ncbi:MAG: tetratricopeptide repeat protein [Chloroflexi bacterium]|nr:tetratricopeptide repeat protein [Chloroflexota bacterium]
MHAPHTLDIRTQTVDRLLKILTLAVVASIVAFAVYYWYDRRPVSQPSMMDRALQMAEKAVQDDPQDAIARVTVSQLYLENQRYDEALSQLQAALEIEKGFLPAERGLGLVYLAQQQYALAEPKFQMIVDAGKDGEFSAADKSLAEGYYYLAQTQLGQGRPQEAIPNLQAALKIDKADADAWMLLGDALVAAGQPDEAVPALQQAIQFDPHFGEAYQAMAQAYQAQGDADRARYAAAMVLYSNGKLDQAIRELVAVTQAKPDLYEAWTGLGLAYEVNGQKDEAFKAYHLALQSDRNDFNPRAGLERLRSGPR